MEEEFGAGKCGPSGLPLCLGNVPVCEDFLFEGLFCLKGLGSSDCHFDLIPGVAFIENAEMVVAGNNGNR